MEWKDMLIENYGSAFRVLDRALQGLTQEDLNWQPRPDCNSTGWTTWHLTRALDGMRMAGFDPADNEQMFLGLEEQAFNSIRLKKLPERMKSVESSDAYIGTDGFAVVTSYNSEI